MDRSAPARIARQILRPDPVDGEVIEIDTGYNDTIVVTVEKEGEIYYETYELADVRKKDEAS